MTDPVLSRDDHLWHGPAGSPRRYLLAPLTRRERNLFRRALVAEGATYPGNRAYFAALRDALRGLAPANLDEISRLVDEAEAEIEAAAPDAPPGPAVIALGPVESAALAVPGFAAVLADRAYYLATYPGVIARHALRGWEGPGLPAFARANGLVPEAAMEAIPDAELAEIGWRAHALAYLTGAAEKNSVPPSPSAETPMPGAAS